MNFNNNEYRLGRRPGKQGPRPLSSDQGRVEKLATERHQQQNQHQCTTETMHELRTTKNILTVGTWNVQTLRADENLEHLRNEMDRFKYDIIGISEVQRSGKGETSSGDFIWSGEETGDMGGVGFLLSVQAKKALISYNPISSRIISARFAAESFEITVIHVYAPASTSSENNINTFYGHIEDTLAATDKKDIIILTGDWNAEIGTDNTGWEFTMGKYGYGHRNRSGECLLNFATKHDFFICNTRFQQKSNRKWTWVSGDACHMTDMILIQKRWKTSLINCRTFQSAKVSSSHSLVLCNIKLRLRTLQNNSQRYSRSRINVERLKHKSIRESYSAILTENLVKVDETCNLEEHAKKIEEAIKSAVNETIVETRVTRKPWVSEQTLKLIYEKHRIKRDNDVSTEYLTKYRNICRQVKKSTRKDKEHWTTDRCKEIAIELNVGYAKQTCNRIKMVRNEFTHRLNAIRDQKGKILHSKEDIMHRMTQYCSNLYKDDGEGDKFVKELEKIKPHNSEYPQEILYNEVKAAMQALKPNKSPGSDGITAEMLQAGGDQLTHQIHKLCNKVWHEGTIPEEWSKSILIPIPKEGDLTDCSNYRMISLINHTGKILLIVLLNRLKQQLDPQLSEEQAGFRKDRTAAHQILTLRLLAETAKRNGKKIYNCFIDFKKAFDTVKHKIIWATLKSYGVEPKVIKLLQNIYEKARSAIRIGHDYGEWFHVDVGTRQGDPLSPLLFIAYLDRVMDQARLNNCGINISGILINNLRFADDIDLIDEDISSLQQQIKLTERAAEQAGLYLNTKKTKMMVFGEKETKGHLEAAGECIENVDRFVYLGCLLTWNNNCSAEIKRRIRKATRAINSLEYTLNSKKLKIENKLKILTTSVFSVLLYASETWTLKQIDKKKLLAFEMRCYRRILNINRQDKIRNEDLRKRVSKEDTILDIIRRRKLRLFGHICRMDGNRLIKQTVRTKLDGEPRRSRSCREWLDDITEWCRRDAKELYDLAQDRRAWDNLIL